MADGNIGETLAVNLIPDPRLTNIIPGGVNVNQTVLSGGLGVSLEKGVEDSSAYVTPWVDYEYAAGDKVCVLIVSSNNLNPPSGGVSLDSSTEQLIWLRGASNKYAEVMVVRCADPTKCRLYAPASSVLTVVKSGVFDLDSWNAMQERNIIYFDGGGLVQASESGYTLPPATSNTLGGVIVGEGLTITPQGVLSVLQQDLPIATQDTAGVVKIGNGLRASADGKLSVRLGDNLSFDEYGNIDASGGSSSVDLSDYYTRSETDGKFLTKEVAEATYAKKEDITESGEIDLSKYYTKTEADERFVEASSPYDGNVGSCTIFVDRNVVTLTLYGVTISGATTSISGSIPSQYRPKNQIVFACGTNEGKAARGSVNTSGSISITQLGGATGTSVFGSVTWGVQ